MAACPSAEGSAKGPAGALQMPGALEVPLLSARCTRLHPPGHRLRSLMGQASRTHHLAQWLPQVVLFIFKGQQGVFFLSCFLFHSMWGSVTFMDRSVSVLLLVVRKVVTAHRQASGIKVMMSGLKAICNVLHVNKVEGETGFFRLPTKLRCQYASWVLVKVSIVIHS